MQFADQRVPTWYPQDREAEAEYLRLRRDLRYDPTGLNRFFPNDAEVEARRALAELNARRVERRRRVEDPELRSWLQSLEPYARTRTPSDRLMERLRKDAKKAAEDLEVALRRDRGEARHQAYLDEKRANEPPVPPRPRPAPVPYIPVPFVPASQYYSLPRNPASAYPAYAYPYRTQRPRAGYRYPQAGYARQPAGHAGGGINIYQPGGQVYINYPAGAGAAAPRPRRRPRGGRGGRGRGYYW